MPRGKGKKAAPKRKSKRLRQINPAPTPKATGKVATSAKATPKSGKKNVSKSKVPDPASTVDELDKKILEMQEQKDKLLAQKSKKKTSNQTVLPDSNGESTDSSSEEEKEEQDVAGKTKKGSNKKSSEEDGTPGK